VLRCIQVSRRMHARNVQMRAHVHAACNRKRTLLYTNAHTHACRLALFMLAIAAMGLGAGCLGSVARG
jgi:hypothetical protein